MVKKFLLMGLCLVTLNSLASDEHPTDGYSTFFERLELARQVKLELAGKSGRILAGADAIAHYQSKVARSKDAINRAYHTNIEDANHKIALGQVPTIFDIFNLSDAVLEAYNLRQAARHK